MSETKTLEIHGKTVNANPYAGLKDISEVAPYDPVKDKALFDKLREVLREYNADDRFGLVLLHDHFEIGSDEWMVETQDEHNRTLTVKPYRSNQLQEPSLELQPTNWRFNSDGQVVTMQVCVKDLQGVHREIL